MGSQDFTEGYYLCFNEETEQSAIDQGHEIAMTEAASLDQQPTFLEVEAEPIEEPSKIGEGPPEVLPVTKNLVIALEENDLCIRPIPCKGKVGNKGGGEGNNTENRELKRLLAT